jgi:cytosine/adenosine deaminase-related metal-dependent hydrolase
VPVSPRAEIVLENVTLVTPGLTRTSNRRLVVLDGRIAAVGASKQHGVGERFVMPGLVDMHTHLPPARVPGLVDLFGLLFLVHGVTGVREIGSIDGKVFDVAREIESGERLGPRIMACGPILDGEPPTLPIARVVRSRAEGEATVRDLAARGALCVKVYEGISADALLGIRSAADASGLELVGHLPSALPVSELPLDDVQHLCYPHCGSMSPEELDAFVERSTTRGVAHTPTLVAFEGQLESTRETKQAVDEKLMPRFWRQVLWTPITQYGNPDGFRAAKALVGRLHQRGVRIHVGTDPIQPFVVPGASFHRELELLVEAGLSVEEALAAATWVAGESLGIGSLGRLEIGAPADLLVLREDPTRDLGALGTLEAVIVDGRLYEIDSLRAALEQQQRYFDRAVVDLSLGAMAEVGMSVAKRSFAQDHAEAGE